MPTPTNIACNTLLAPADLKESDLDRVMDQILSHSIDSADMYFQSSRLESWVLEDGIIRDGSYNIEQGVGIRAISGEKTGFAYSDEILLPNLLEAGKSARAIARSGGSGNIQIKGDRPLQY